MTNKIHPARQFLEFWIGEVPFQRVDLPPLKISMPVKKCQRVGGAKIKQPPP